MSYRYYTELVEFGTFVDLGISMHRLLSSFPFTGSVGGSFAPITVTKETQH